MGPRGGGRETAGVCRRHPRRGHRDGGGATTDSGVFTESKRPQNSLFTLCENARIRCCREREERGRLDRPACERGAGGVPKAEAGPV